MKNLIYCFLLVGLFSCNSGKVESDTNTDSTAVETTEPQDALDTAGGKGVFFVELKDSQEVKSPFMVKMNVVGMDVEPAGAVNGLKGHHHLIIDGQSTPQDEPVINDETHLHFGKGQTETEVKLTPGYHTLTLQFANGMHSSYGPRWSRTISVRVK